MQRIRIKYAKTQPLKYTGSLDMQKVWERTLRRCRISLAYSQGFHPQPRIQQANPLPLGILSQAELVDFWLENEYNLDELRLILSERIQPGIELLEIHEIPQFAPAMQTQVIAAEYRVRLPNDHPTDELTNQIITVLESKSILRERRGKEYDLRPLILDISLVMDPDSAPELLMKLSCKEGATGRADEVLIALNLNPAHLKIRRTALITLPENG